MNFVPLGSSIDGMTLGPLLGGGPGRRTIQISLAATLFSVKLSAPGAST